MSNQSRWYQYNIQYIYIRTRVLFSMTNDTMWQQGLIGCNETKCSGQIILGFKLSSSQYLYIYIETSQFISQYIWKCLF